MYYHFLEQYHLQMEMASGQYVLALCSLMDTKEGFLRLAEALEEIDASPIWMQAQFCGFGQKVKGGFILEEDKDFYSCIKSKTKNIYRPQIQKLQIYETDDFTKTRVCLSEAIGKISGEYLFLYPPGIPFLVPGEFITDEVIQDIEQCQAQGLEVHGLVGGKVSIISNG